MIDNPGNQVIVRSTIDLARNLGLTSTAEGVETVQSLEWLAGAGCDQAQGYHIARPMPANALTAWLEERRELADAVRRRLHAPTLVAIPRSGDAALVAAAK